MKTYQSSSSEETKKFGKEFAKTILKSKPRRSGATVFALSGELGAGKTTFVQGFFQGLGIKKRAISPTFIIMRRHAIKNKRFANVHHVDAYRIKRTGDLGPLGFEKIFQDQRNIILIEWAENIKKILPKGTMRLKFRHGSKEHERTIRA